MRKKILAGIAVAALAIQCVPVDRRTAPAEAPLHAGAKVMSVLRRSCFDCHSQEPRWPWYGYVAPVSWLLKHHMNEGRAQIDFSTWGAYTQKRKALSAEAIVDVVAEGEMPLKSYLLLHRDAAVSSADLAVLQAWAASVAEAEAEEELGAGHEENH